MSNKKNITQHINNYVDYITNVKKLSSNTIKNYKNDLAKFDMYFSNFDIHSIKSKDINDFIAQNAELSPASMNRMITTVKMFFQWLVNTDVLSKSPALSIERPKQEKKMIDVITEEEKENILLAANDPKNSRGVKNYFRDYAIINLLFSTGMRRDELVNVKVSDLSLDNNSLLIAKGKGGKQRTAYYNNKTRMILSEYLYSHRKLYGTTAKSEYLFISTQSRKLSDPTINNIVNRFMTAAGCKKKGRSVHNTRKRFATDIYLLSHDIYAVASLCGHSNIQTATKYAQIVEQENKRLCMNL